MKLFSSYTRIIVLLLFNLYCCLSKKTGKKVVNLRKTSKSLLKYVDLKKNPCDNFHEFSCGKFMESKKDHFNPQVDMDSFNDFVRNTFEGKDTKQTKVTKTLVQMFKKCLQFRNNDELFFNCNMKVEKFGLYAFASYFVSDIVSNPRIDLDYEVVNKMVTFIKEEFKKLLDEKKDFLDEKTKQNYLKKIDGIQLYREHHNRLKDISLMEKCYSYFKFSQSDSARVMLKKIDKYALFIPTKTDKKTKKLCKHYIVDGRSEDASLLLLVTENAFYDSKENRFTINPMMFREPYFDKEYPMSINYGSLGFVIGHELMHALDYYNINLDHTGNINVNMTSIYSMGNYKEKSKCFLKQYNYRRKNIDLLEMFEMFRLKEDIADNGGIKIAFRAYKSYYKSIQKSSPKIQKFKKYTGDQMFFISYGRFFCKHFVLPNNKMNKMNEKFVKHNPIYLRIKNTLGNFDEFSKAYQCPVDSNMNPKKKCELW